MQGCLNSLNMFNSVQDCNLPEIVTQTSTPDFDILVDLLQDKTSILIVFGGVGFTDIDYTNLCSRLAKDLNALVICPNFSDGTELHYLNVKKRQMEKYNYDIPMYTDNQERKDQNDIKSKECYQIIDVLREATATAGIQNLPIHILGHSFGGCSAIHMLCNTQERHKIDKVVSLGGSIGVGLDETDWYNLLNTSEYGEQHQYLQIHEANFATSVGANAIYSKLLIGDLISSGRAKSNHEKEASRNWDATLDNQKQQIINAGMVS